MPNFQGNGEHDTTLVSGDLPKDDETFVDPEVHFCLLAKAKVPSNYLSSYCCSAHFINLLLVLQ